MANDSKERKKSDLKSDLILEEIMRRKEKERIVNVEEKMVKVVIFSLHQEFYAFYGEYIKEILLVMTISYVPGSPDFIAGVINNRGEIESVVKINRFLDFPDSQVGDNCRIVLAEQEGIRSGILVDSIEDVLDIPVSGIRVPLDALAESIKELVTGEFLHRDKPVTILDIGKIFGKITV
jgi:purine-binding chemotaxis protein CheW